MTQSKPNTTRTLEPVLEVVSTGAGMPGSRIDVKKPAELLPKGAEIRTDKDLNAFVEPAAERWGLRNPSQERPLKRAFDIVISAFLLIALSLLFLTLWSLVRATSRGPGLYWSERLGRNGITFRMPKFRSMALDTPELPREQFDGAASHITPIGKILRSTSLDEIPQFWSVLRGDMSLIGPRPLLPTDPGIRARWDFPDAIAIQPGMTGLAQVRGRNLVSPRLKARLDSFYAKHGGWGLDLYIIYRTVIVVLSRQGIV